MGRVQNYSSADLSTIEDLARFARANTPKDSVFLFADAGKSPVPASFEPKVTARFTLTGRPAAK